MVRSGPDAYLSPPTSANAWSRTFLQTALPMPAAQFRQHADVYLATLAGAFGPVRLLPDVLSRYRVHGSNDYASKADDEKARRNMEIYAHRCTALSRYLADRYGRSIDAASWMGPGTPYEWISRLHTAMEAVKRVIPVGATYLLVDEDQWGERRGGGDVLSDRRSIPFLERQGQYNGPPPDDATAISEFERLRAAGAQFAVIAWPAFWWLEHYADFAVHLRNRYPILTATADFVVFDLRAGQ
jgi:hypothetical protein